MTDYVLVDRPAEGVAVVTLNRPEKLNALVPELLAQFGEAVQAANADDSVRALVLTGAGKGFCAGLDLMALGEGAKFGTGADAFKELTKPIIGAINGVAVTGGLEIALQCDFRIGSTNARFADTHARIGIVPGWGMTVRLPQAVGEAWARRMSFTGDFVDAEQALEIGLITELVEPDQLLPRAIEIASSVATTEPKILSAIRSIYNIQRDGTGAEGLQAEQDFRKPGGFTTADMDTFAARREAVFARGKAQQ